jgi:thioredoxin reductase
VAELATSPEPPSDDERPFPPGDYPVVVVGSGPGGLQTSYCLTRLGVEHAVISQDDAPGGMFRRWPIFGRLLSWTKPDAPYPRESREYEWYDHNSLVGDEPEHRALVAAEMDRRYMVPSRDEMARGLIAFAEKGGVRVRYGCRWESTVRSEGGFTLVTSDGEYGCRAVVFATGVTDPWRSPIPGLEQVAHYIDCRNGPDYQGKRLFIVGKRNSAFEIADGLVPWAKQVILGSPRPVQASVIALASVRVRYFQPYEDSSWGGGTIVLDAAIERVERAETGWRVHAKSTTGAGELPPIEVDEVIAATGFCTPLQDLVDLGVETVAQGRIPALTPFWESVTVPGVYFAGNATQGAAGLRRHGTGSASGTVSGFRYNARLLARHLAETRLGQPVERPTHARDEVVPYLLAQLKSGPELWTQKAYLARVVSLDTGRNEGIMPLAHFVDSAGPDAIAATVEMDSEARIYPVLYLRRSGKVDELVMGPDPLHDFGREEYRRELESLLRL